MKNKRLLTGIVLSGIVLILVLVCGLLLSKRSGNRSDQNAPDTVADLVIPPYEAPAVDAEHGDMPDRTDEDEQQPVENQIMEPEEEDVKEKDSGAEKKRAWIEEKLDTMTIEEKVCQLFMLSPEKLTGVSQVVAAGDVTKNAIQNYPVGGIIYFGPNIETPQQIAQMISNTQGYAMDRSGLPLFIAVDEEGGYVTRIAKNSNFDVPTFPYASEIGQSGNVSDAREMGDAIGAYLESYGFNVDFAPVADVLSNAENQVVKKRSFGSDPQLVSDMVLAELDGLEQHRMIGCVKHFPGHGATVGDTHEGYAYTEKTWEELLECEAIPFADSIKHGVSMVMVGHISLPNVVGDHTPASMSHRMITEHLREELGYDGIVITDSLGMGAITNSYSSRQVAVSVLKAGGDILLDPADFKSAYEGILAAINDGELTEARIDESVSRILSVKYELMEE